MNKESYLREYNQLLSGEIPYFTYNYPYEEIAEKNVHLYAGSFNPRHEMHDLIFNSARYYALNSSLTEGIAETPFVGFELSLVRRNKFSLEYDELMQRLSQFTEPVIVTNADFFVKKTGAINIDHDKNLFFHIGIDTVSRLIDDDTILGVQGINAKFVVYPRDGYGLDEMIKEKKPIPANMFCGTYFGEYKNGVSSTAIRKGKCGAF